VVSYRTGRARLSILYSGHVQGVGFRHTVKSLATGYDVTGVVRNLSDGRVELVAEGAEPELAAFREAILQTHVGRFVKDERKEWLEGTGEFRGFEIVR
jgi:acylphosphatase